MSESYKKPFRNLKSDLIQLNLCLRKSTINDYVFVGFLAFVEICIVKFMYSK